MIAQLYWKMQYFRMRTSIFFFKKTKDWIKNYIMVFIFDGRVSKLLVFACLDVIYDKIFLKFCYIQIWYYGYYIRDI